MRTLKPRMSVYITGALALIWMAGFGMLTWNLSSLLSQRCTVELWSHETGVMICRMYKALESFTIIAMYVRVFFSFSFLGITNRQQGYLPL
jgi:hypothetical protein